MKTVLPTAAARAKPAGRSNPRRDARPACLRSWRTAWLCWGLVCLSVAGLLPGRARAGDPSPTPAAKPDIDDAPLHPLNIPLPLVRNEPSKNLKLPEYGMAGQLMSLIKAGSVKKLDDDHLQMEHMLIDLYKTDGQLDFSIDLPTSSFNLKTRMIASIDPVVIKSPQFVLSGERFKYNTYTREGELIGHVTMKIFNLKTAVTPPGSPASAASPAPALSAKPK